MNMRQNPNHRLLGQTCIVRGANSGIGMEVAMAMGRDCANVVVNYVSDPVGAEELKNIQRQAFAGMLWSKQY